MSFKTVRREPTESLDDNQTASAGKFGHTYFFSCTYTRFRLHSHKALFKIIIMIKDFDIIFQ